MVDNLWCFTSGLEYGKVFSEPIIRNLKTLVWREGYEPLPHNDRGFTAWVQGQEGLLATHWPWLLEEMVRVARGAGVRYEDILLLNLRAWQYRHYGAGPAPGACSSLAIILADGTVAAAGALDDPAEYYCGPVRFIPEVGYPFITFPLTGTGWGNRGMNREGLSVGISSQLLPGLRRLEHAVNQDLAVRVILQTCRTVQDVRAFCRRHPFTLNLVVVDADGDIFCAHQTAAGLFEIPADGGGALTNHVVDAGIKDRLRAQGVIEFSESPTTVPRRRCLMDFANAARRKCSFREVMDFIGLRDDSNPGTIHNRDSIYLTASNPPADPHTLWILQPQNPRCKLEFIPYPIEGRP